MQRRNFLKNSVLLSTGTIMSPALLANAARLGQNGIQLNVHAGATGEKFTHFWSKCVGAGRANEGLRASWLEQLQLVKDHCGFEYCRFHGLFHDDMFVYREVDGKGIYNWQYIDDLFDRMLAIGVKPFVELGFVPRPMASTERTQFWWKGNIAPPKDYGAWARLVSAFVQHCISRYGLTQVRSWYFEVWNEPDLHVFWDGTKTQYFELYKASVNAIKAIDPQLKVGGPATSNFVPDDRFAGELEDKTKHKTHTVADLNSLEWKGVWIEDFLQYCKKEKLPVDFVSTHPYPTDWAVDPETKKGAGRVRKVGATKDDLLWLQKAVAASSYAQAEIHLTEWSSSPSPRDPGHDSLQAAAYIIKVNLDCIGLTRSLSYWTFTDVFEEGGAGNSIFHGGFGMINYQGIVKPSFHAYRMLHALGDEILQREEGMIVTRHKATGKLVALVYHFPEEMKDAVSDKVDMEAALGKPRSFKLNLKGLHASQPLQLETLDQQHGFGLAAWKQMGSPEPPDRAQTEQLKKTAMSLLTEKAKANAAGVYTMERLLAPWSCMLISTSI